MVVKMYIAVWRFYHDTQRMYLIFNEVAIITAYNCDFRQFKCRFATNLNMNNQRILKYHGIYSQELSVC